MSSRTQRRYRPAAYRPPSAARSRGSRGLLDLKSRGLTVHNPELTFATPDHAISTPRGRAGTIKIGQELLAALRVETSASGIQMFDVDQPGQGIVHVIGPELGLSLPGCLIVCGDSHTCTHGGLGALAFGVGSSEADACAGDAGADASAGRRPCASAVEGELRAGRHRQGPDPAHRSARSAPPAAPATPSNMPAARSAACRSRGGSRSATSRSSWARAIGMVAPDETTFEYLRGRPYAPEGRDVGRRSRRWRAAAERRRRRLRPRGRDRRHRDQPAGDLGHQPRARRSAIDGRVPDPAGRRPIRRGAPRWNRARLHGPRGRAADRRHAGRLGLHRLLHQQPPRATCAPPPRSRAAARSRRVSRAWVVPGSETRQARGRGRRARQGLRRGRLRMARARLLDVPGRQWRARWRRGSARSPPPTATSSAARGRGARTHLASPAMAAAAAIAGAIADVRTMER